MIGLILLLLPLLVASPARAEESTAAVPGPEASPAAGSLRLPEVVLFARDTLFLPVPRPPAPSPDAPQAPPARLVSLEVAESSLFPPAVWAERSPGMATAAAGGSANAGAGATGAPMGPARAAGREAPAGRPPPASGGAAEPERDAAWAIALWPTDELEARVSARRQGRALSISASLRGALAGGWAGFDADLPTWALLEGRVGLGEGAAALGAAGGVSSLSGTETRLLARVDAGLQTAAGALDASLESQGLGLWRTAGAGGAAPARLLLGSFGADLRLACTAGLPAATLEPALRLQLAGWGSGEVSALSALHAALLVTLEGKLAFENLPLTASAGVAFRSAAGREAVQVFPQAGLELALSPQASLVAAAGAFLRPLPAGAAALLETLPDTSAMGAERGWSASAGLSWVPGPRLQVEGEYLQGELLAADAGRIAIEPAQRVGLNLSASGDAGRAHFDLFYRGEQELPAGGFRQSFGGGWRAGFPKTPLEAIIRGEWSDHAVGMDEARRFPSLRAVPGWRAGLGLTWRLKDRTRLAALLEVLEGAGQAPPGLRFGLSWGSAPPD